MKSQLNKLVLIAASALFVLFSAKASESRSCVTSGGPEPISIVVNQDLNPNNQRMVASENCNAHVLGTISAGSVLQNVRILENAGYEQLTDGSAFWTSKIGGDVLNKDGSLKAKLTLSCVDASGCVIPDNYQSGFNNIQILFSK